MTSVALDYLRDPSHHGGVIPIAADGAYPQRAGSTVSSDPGSTDLRPTANAIAQSKEFAASFVAQMQQSMMDSLAELGAAGDEQDAGDSSGEDAGMGGIGLGADFDQSQLMATIYTGMQSRGASPAQIQAQLAALQGADELVGAGAGDEAALSQQLLGATTATTAFPGLAASAAPGSTGTLERGLAANAKVVAAEAHKQGVDPAVAVAMMLVESGGRNNAVGDNGTSFGLFQLHEGGMLTAAGLSSTQAFDPAINARVALSSYRHEYDKGHARRTPGEIAAASQRPADPAGYARKVDAALDRARTLLAG